MTRTQEVLIFVRRGEEFLALHRSPENDAYWHSAAGGVEEGETYADAAVRELREETGLAAEPQPLGSTFDYGGITVECFLVDAPDEWEPELDWEHDDYRWCTATDAADLMHWPEPAAVLRGFAA
jgi:8-oxo-dGTP pyrophosphatase MutT (NUDIX family)